VSALVGCGGVAVEREAEHEAESGEHELAASDTLAVPAPADKLYPTSNPDDGEAGSGPRATAYHAGGRRVTDEAVTARAPDARLFHTGYGGWEPSIGTTRDGTIFFAARNSNADPGVARSTDDGRTWERSNPAAHQTSLDPFIWVDRASGRVFSSDISPTVTCPPISNTADGGKTWSTTLVCGHADYQKIFGGPAPKDAAQPEGGYPSVVYFCAISGGEGAGSVTYNQCSKSLDGGGSFSMTGEPSYPIRAAPAGAPAPNCDGGAAPGVVDAKGTVYIPRGWCGEPYIAISKDEGDSWDRIKLPGKPLPYDADNGAWANDSGVAVDADGNLFYVWVAEDLHPYFTTSRDGGKTWAQPLDILPPGVARTSNPAIDVGDPGRVAISFIGSEQDKKAKPEDVRWNAYLAESTDALSSDPLFYAASVNDPANNTFWKGDCTSPIRCGNMGDFYDVVVAPDGTPHGAFVDSCPGKDVCTAFGVTDPRGEAVMGQLAGGPPLVGTVAEQQPGVTLPGPAPASRSCRSRRNFRIRLRQPRHGRLASARVYVNGKRVRLIRGSRLRAPVDLRGLPKGTYVVRVVVTTTTGRRVVRTRRYRTCAPR
jgi:hypothetical protein